MKLSKRSITKIAISRAQNKLFLGAIMDHLDYMLDAVEEGADLHAEDDKALELAAEQGNLKIVKFLVENGANPAANDYAAIKKAKEKGEKFVVEFLDKVTVPKNI
jgi:ankyrin repeat protein